MARFTYRISLVLCVFAFAVSMQAQLPTGSIDGIVKDPSGRLVQGAHIAASNDLQGTVRESASNADGSSCECRAARNESAV